MGSETQPTNLKEPKMPTTTVSYHLLDNDGDEMFIRGFDTPEEAQRAADGHVRHPRMFPQPWRIERRETVRHSIAEILAASPSTCWFQQGQA